MGSLKDFDEIKAHKWFKDIDWALLNEKKITAPFIPKISGDNYLDNFDEEFIKEGKFSINPLIFINIYRSNKFICWNR